MPDLFIITGSNGAGKSSVGFNYIPYHLQSKIFDGDKLLLEKKKELWKNTKSPKIISNQALEFVRQTFADLVESAINNSEDFAYEGHFTNDETWEIPKKFKQNGYKIHLIFFGLKNTDLSQLRVIDRTKEGGHFVDWQTLTSNFYGNLEKLDVYFPLFDSVKIFETSLSIHKELAIIENGTAIFFADGLPEWFTQNLINISKLNK